MPLSSALLPALFPALGKTLFACFVALLPRPLRRRLPALLALALQGLLRMGLVAGVCSRRLHAFGITAPHFAARGDHAGLKSSSRQQHSR